MSAPLRWIFAAWLLSSCVLVILAQRASAAEWSFELKGDESVRVLDDGKQFTEYLTKNGPKPILWPIIGPGGREMTRAYPMRTVEGEKHDHPHQRSLWFTHGDVNGIDFWAEGKGKGSIATYELLPVRSNERVLILSNNDWLGPDGKRVCRDKRSIAFSGGPDARTIDFEIELIASDGPVKFGDTKEGTFGIRVPTVMDVSSKKGGHIVNSHGHTDDATWGKQAPWVDYHGPVDGQEVGIAVLNHPSSFRFPTYWHVRPYGLFAANPFGVKDFTLSKDADGSHTIQGGESIKLRYRVIFHAGDEKAAKVAEAYEAYAKESRQ